MPAGRRRKTVPRQARLQRWGALGAAVLAATAVVPVASALEAPKAPARSAAAAHHPGRAAARAAAFRASRDLVRPEPAAARMAVVDRFGPVGPATATPAVDLSARWVTVALTVWTGPAVGSKRLAVLAAGGKVMVTGTVRGAWAQVSHGGRLAWVHKEFLSTSKPRTAAARPTFAASGKVSGAPCSDGSSVESGLVPHTVEVYRAVCAAFPAVTTWGGRSGDGGDHGSGHALDIMCSGSLGDAIAAYVRAHAASLGVSYVIWSQHIWSVQRSSEGWRPMPDRGSTTANHYDHVHVSTY